MVELGFRNSIQIYDYDYNITQYFKQKTFKVNYQYDRPFCYKCLEARGKSHYLYWGGSLSFTRRNLYFNESKWDFWTANIDKAEYAEEASLTSLGFVFGIRFLYKKMSFDYGVNLGAASYVDGKYKYSEHVEFVASGKVNLNKAGNFNRILSGPAPYVSHLYFKFGFAL